VPENKADVWERSIFQVKNESLFSCPSIMGKTEEGNQGNLYSVPFQYSNQFKFTRYKEFLLFWF